MYSYILNISYSSLTISKHIQENWRRCREGKTCGAVEVIKWTRILQAQREMTEE